MAGSSPPEKYGKSTVELAATHTSYAELPGDGRSLVELPTPLDGKNGFQVHGDHEDGPKSGL